MGEYEKQHYECVTGRPWQEGFDFSSLGGYHVPLWKIPICEFPSALASDNAVLEILEKVKESVDFFKECGNDYKRFAWLLKGVDFGYDVEQQQIIKIISQW